MMLWEDVFPFPGVYSQGPCYPGFHVFSSRWVAWLDELQARPRSMRCFIGTHQAAEKNYCSKIILPLYKDDFAVKGHAKHGDFTLLRDRIRNLACGCSEMIYSRWSPKARCVCRWSGSCRKQARQLGRSLRIQLYTWWSEDLETNLNFWITWRYSFVHNIQNIVSDDFHGTWDPGLRARVDGPYGVGIPQMRKFWKSTEEWCRSQLFWGLSLCM